MLNFITLIGICLLTIILIVCLMNPQNLNYKNLGKENFTVFHPDLNIRNRINEVNEQKRIRNKESNKTRLELNQTHNINQIETRLSNYDIILSSIMENINDVPECREIDLFPRRAPGESGVTGSTCEDKTPEVCELNPYCELVSDATSGIQTCNPKSLISECANIMVAQPTTAINPVVNYKPNRFFLYPNVLNKVSTLL